jgi:hypothetical protein
MLEQAPRCSGSPGAGWRFLCFLAFQKGYSVPVLLWNQIPLHRQGNIRLKTCLSWQAWIDTIATGPSDHVSKV